MLTPQEVSEHAFSKASFGGYNMAMVDEFLDTLTEDYTALYKENTALKAKMKVLVDKVEEYRATEDAMRKALLTAQTMADEMVREAEKKKAEVLSQAENEAKEHLAAIRQELANEETRLTAAKNATAVHVAKVRELYQRELEYLDGLDALSAPPQQAAPAVDPVAAAVAEIESNMTRMMDGESAPAPTFENPFSPKTEDPAPPQDEKADTVPFQTVPVREAKEAPTRRLDLDGLQFGKDFDLE